MIDINLIPPALRKNGKGPSSSLAINIPKDILLGAGFGLVLFLLAVHLILGVVWFLGFEKLSMSRAQWQDLAPDKKILDGINNESADLKKKISLVSDITTRKAVLWAPKFNAISDALPRGLWLRKMVLDKTGLSMEGSVVSKSQSEITNIGLFLSALKQNDGFMNGFQSLEVNSIERGKSNSVEVTDFIVMAKLNESRSK